MPGDIISLPRHISATRCLADAVCRLELAGGTLQTTATGLHRIRAEVRTAGRILTAAKDELLDLAAIYDGYRRRLKNNRIEADEVRRTIDSGDLQECARLRDRIVALRSCDDGCC